MPATKDTIVINRGTYTTGFDNFDPSNSSNSFAPSGWRISNVSYVDGVDRFYRILRMDGSKEDCYTFLGNGCDTAFAMVGSTEIHWDEVNYSQKDRGFFDYPIYDAEAIYSEGGHALVKMSAGYHPGAGATIYPGEMVLFGDDGLNNLSSEFWEAAPGMPTYLQDQYVSDSRINIAISLQDHKFYVYRHLDNAVLTHEVGGWTSGLILVSSDTRKAGPLTWSVIFVPYDRDNDYLPREQVRKVGSVYISGNVVSRNPLSTSWTRYNPPSSWSTGLYIQDTIQNYNGRVGFIGFESGKNGGIYLLEVNPQTYWLEPVTVLSKTLISNLPDDITSDMISTSYVGSDNPLYMTGGFCVIRLSSNPRGVNYIYSYDGGATWNFPTIGNGKIYHSNFKNGEAEFITHNPNATSILKSFSVSTNFRSYLNHSIPSKPGVSEGVGMFLKTFGKSKAVLSRSQRVQSSSDGRNWRTVYDGTMRSFSDSSIIQYIRGAGNRVIGFAPDSFYFGWLSAFGDGDFTLRNSADGDRVEDILMRNGLISNRSEVRGMSASSEGGAGATSLTVSKNNYMNRWAITSAGSSFWHKVTIPYSLLNSRGFSYNYNLEKYANIRGDEITTTSDFKSYSTIRLPPEVIFPSSVPSLVSMEGIFIIAYSNGVTFASDDNLQSFYRLPGSLYGRFSSRGCIYTSTVSDLFIYTKDGESHESFHLLGSVAIRSVYEPGAAWKIGSI